MSPQVCEKGPAPATLGGALGTVSQASPGQTHKLTLPWAQQALTPPLSPQMSDEAGFFFPVWTLINCKDSSAPTTNQHTISWQGSQTHLAGHTFCY